jgi:hypothetical protein
MRRDRSADIDRGVRLFGTNELSGGEDHREGNAGARSS